MGIVAETVHGINGCSCTEHGHGQMVMSVRRTWCSVLQTEQSLNHKC